MDYEFKRCTRHCAASGRELEPREEFYSALLSQGAELVRQDYCLESWDGPPEGAIGWWKSRMPEANAKKTSLAPNDVILDLFEQCENQTDKQEMRYVLALLLLRRRVVRLEETETDESGDELMILSCPRRETTYRVATAAPDSQRTESIQAELAQLLFAEAG